MCAGGGKHPKAHAARGARERAALNIVQADGGCPARLILRMSSRVTSSLLNRPPCTTKYRLRPSGERMTSLMEPAGGFVAQTSVASGTVEIEGRSDEHIVQKEKVCNYFL